MQMDATKGFPNEILGLILKFYIQDFFSLHVNPCGRPPAPLHVCRKWRQVAINTPECWTNLKFLLNTRSRYGYGRRNISQRPTRGKAAQDTIKTYFTWARTAPVDLSLSFTGNITKDFQKNLVPWLLENMPMLRRLALDRSRGVSVDMLMQSNSDCLTHLTHLRLDTQSRSYRDYSTVLASGQVIAPNLLVAYIQGSCDIVKVLEAPRLKYLFVSDWDLGKIGILVKFPLLRELYLERVNGRAPEFRHEGLRRLAIRHPPANDAHHFMMDSRKVFPSVTTWCPGPILAKRLIDDKLSELDLRFLKTLALFTYSGREYLSHDVAYVAQLITFWERLPGLTHLTLGILWNGQYPSLESEINPDYQPMPPNAPYYTPTQIIYSLGCGTADRQPCLPSLEQLEIQDIGLDSNLLTALHTFLRFQIEPVPIEEETNDIRGHRKLTIRRSLLEARQLTPPRSFGICGDTTFTSTEFKKFAAVLERHGFFADTIAV